MYSHLFCPPTTDDETKDLRIQTQIRSLHWVTAEQLDTLMNENDAETRTHVDQAITGGYSVSGYSVFALSLYHVTEF